MSYANKCTKTLLYIVKDNRLWITCIFENHRASTHVAVVLLSLTGVLQIKSFCINISYQQIVLTAIFEKVFIISKINSFACKSLKTVKEQIYFPITCYHIPITCNIKSIYYHQTFHDYLTKHLHHFHL